MHIQVNSKKSFPYRAVAGGMIAMFLAFGVGRFAYTPLLPLMQEQAGLAVDMAGYLASLMYLGYLAGSVLVTKNLARFGAFTVLRFGLGTLVLATWSMSAGDIFWYWALMMFCIGLASAAIFLSTLSLFLGIFLDYGAGWLTAFLYTGIGSAIVLIGLAVPELGAASGWQAAWHFVSGTALAGGILNHFLLSPYAKNQQKASSSERTWALPGAKRAAIFLIAAYFLHGFAYTIGSTFMVAILNDFPGLDGLAHIGWILVGAMVVPSCVIWPLVASRAGEVKTVAFLLALLAGSNLLVVIWQSPVGVLVAAAIFGSSFLAIPGLVLGRLGKLAGDKKDAIIGYATIIFGVAMVLGPAVGGLVTKLTGSFDWSLVMACVVLLCAAVVALMAETTKTLEVVIPKGRAKARNIPCD